MRQLRPSPASAFLEEVDLSELARKYGTPLYVYSRAAIEESWQEWRAALRALPTPEGTSAGGRAQLSYAVKANSNLSIIRLFADLDAGFDIVSGGELTRVLAAGGDAGRVVFSGVGKTRDELRQACRHAIACINLESEFEYHDLCALIEEQAPNTAIKVAVRLNPGVTAGGHDYISTGSEDSKFGLALEAAIALAKQASGHAHLRFAGIVSHIGSEIRSAEPYTRALDLQLEAVSRLAREGIATPVIGIGGGQGLEGASREELCRALADHLSEGADGQPPPLLAFEPGRSLIAKAGLLLTEALGVKRQQSRSYIVVDAAMNDYIRPALYGAQVKIINVNNAEGEGPEADVVGPICESGDFLVRGAKIPAKAGDILALLDVGAYGMSMSSNYNSRPRAAEVLVEGDKARLIRPREDINGLISAEAGCLVRPG